MSDLQPGGGGGGGAGGGGSGGSSSDGSSNGSSLGGEASSLLRNPTGYIREVIAGLVVGGILSALTFGVEIGLDIMDAFRGVLTSGGGAVLDSIDSVWLTVVTLVALPIETVESVAVGVGPFAPLVAALAFAVTAAVVTGVIWGLYRVVRFI